MRIIAPTTVTADMITDCNVPEDDYPEWDAETVYYINNMVLYDHKIYEGLNTSINNPPDIYSGTSTSKWMLISNDNRHKMFDAIVGSQTEIAETLTITLAPGQTDTVSFLDIEATEIVVSMTDPIEGLVYSDTIDLVSKSGIVDAYTYFFQPIITDDSVVLLGIPPYINGSFEITINNPGGTVRVGTLAFGMQADLGWTQYDPTIGINDYSKKEVDIFGNYSILERAFSKKLSCEIFLDNSLVDYVVRKLAEYRATPVIWVAVDSGFSTMIIYGFYRSFAVTVKYVSHSTCSLEIEGLT